MFLPVKDSNWAYSISRDVLSVCAYISNHIIITTLDQSLTNVYIQIYIDIHVRISLGGLNLGTFFAKKLKSGILLTQILTFNTILELPWVMPLGRARGQNV